MMDQGQQEAELGSQRKRPVEVCGHRSSLAGYRRNGGKQIAGKRSDLEPPRARILAAPDRQDQRPGETDNDEQQKQGEKRPPDFGIEHGRRL